MEAGTRLVVYDDSPVFGGHEVMTLLGLSGLLGAGVAVLFVHAAQNSKLRDALLPLKKAHPHLELYEHPTPSRKLQGIRNRFEKSQINQLAELFCNYDGDAVLCAQGDLELSSRGLLAGKRARRTTVSYIPFAHSQADMGAKLGRYRDPFNSYLLGVPDAIITISHEAASHFRRRGAKGPIHVVYNGIDLTRFGGAPGFESAQLAEGVERPGAAPQRVAAKAEARGAFSLPEEGFIIGLCGRLECVQKGQNLLLEAVSSSPFLRSEVLTLLVGDGPDETQLRAEVARLGLGDAVRFTGWCDPAPLYPALDALVIASRFEGMPLVMLEALASNVPVVATDRDGMKEILPSAWRYPAGDARALARNLEEVLKQPDTETLARLRRRVCDEMSVTAFQTNFTKTILQLCRGVS